MVITILVTFFFTPYLIEKLGKGQYGIWSLVFSLVAYMKLADIGMNQALARYISKYYALNDWKQLNQIISSAARIYLLVSLFIVGLSVVISFGVMHHFKMRPEYLKIAQITLVVIATNQAVTYMFIPFAALLPFHRADIVNYFDIAQLLLQTFSIVILLELGYGLVAMSIIVLMLNIILHIIRYGIRHRMFPDVSFSFQSITSEKTQQLLSYGMTSLLIVAAWIVIFQTDNIIIGRYLSMEAVAVFAVPASIVILLRNSIMAIAIPIVPTISHIETEQDDHRVMDIYLKSSGYLYYLSSYICILLLLYGGPFILLWVKESFNESIVILQVLIVPACIYLPQMIANSVLFGVSRHIVLFYILAAEAISNIILSLILVHRLGIFGVALGTAIPQTFIYLFVYPIVFYRVMNSKLMSFYKTSIRSLLFAVAFTLPVAFFMDWALTPDSWLNLIVDCLVTTFIMLFGFARFILDSEDRARIAIKIKSKLSLIS